VIDVDALLGAILQALHDPGFQLLAGFALLVIALDALGSRWRRR
jgi:hypothetical protein